MRVAAVSMSVGGTQGRFFPRLTRAVTRASLLGAELVVLPELCVLDLLADEPGSSETIPPRLAEHAETYVRCLTQLAESLQLTIVGGSHIEQRGRGFRNVSATVFPDGRIVRSEKQILTQWEAVEWGLEPGVGHLPIDSIGVLICYDCEFPELVRPLAEAGIRVLCVPSYTETRHGFQRVRWSCQARAIENQIFVVHASLVGSLGKEPVPSTYGASGILAPSVPPFPDNPILATTAMNRPGIAVADLDLGAIAVARDSGDVRNWADYLAHCRRLS